MSQCGKTFSLFAWQVRGWHGVCGSERVGGIFLGANSVAFGEQLSFWKIKELVPVLVLCLKMLFIVFSFGNNLCFAG